MSANGVVTPGYKITTHYDPLNTGEWAAANDPAHRPVCGQNDFITTSSEPSRVTCQKCLHIMND